MNTKQLIIAMYELTAPIHHGTFFPPEKKSFVFFTNRPMKRPAASTMATYATTTARSNVDNFPVICPHYTPSPAVRHASSRTQRIVEDGWFWYNRAARRYSRI